MKVNYWLSIPLVFAVVSVQAQPGQQASSPAVLTSAAVLSPATISLPVERGRDHTVWERYRSETNRLGRVLVHTNRVVELETGKHYLQDGRWVESREEIQIVENGAVATNGPHQAAFAVNVNSPVSVEVRTPDSTRLKIRPLCLMYYDFHKREHALIAELKNSDGLLVGTNQVIYPDAFTGCLADIRYTYRKSGLEQDVILRQRPPLPEDYGFNPTTTWLWVLTEFIDPPENVQVTRQIRQGWKKSTVDPLIDLGAMKIVPGTAFSLGAVENRRKGVPVQKHWTVIDGRTVLIEEVSFPQIVSRLRDLEASVGPDAGGSSFLADYVPSKKLSLPAAPPAGTTANRTIQVASLAPDWSGLVLDLDLQTGTNVVLRGDTTYLVTGNVNLTSAVIEGGTVVKYNRNACVNLLGPVKCLTEPYRPAVFTAVDDNTVGAAVDGSSGNPNGWYAGCALAAWNSADLKYLNVRYAYGGVYFCGGYFTLSHAQFGSCYSALLNVCSYFTNCNLLMYRVEVPFDLNYSHGLVEHLTCDQARVLTDDYSFSYQWWCEPNPASSSLTLVNSLTTSITNGYGEVPITTNHVQNVSSGSGVFQTIGAGSYYLADGSTHRNAGTTDIQPGLAAALRAKTTYPPLLYSNVTITTDTTLWTQAQRDTDIPDIGYHYDPIDYFCSCSVSNATLTLTNGVAVAYVGYTDLWLQNGGRLVSGGTPLQRNHIVYYNLVQEQPVNLAAPYGHGLSLPFFFYHSDFSRNPSLALRFTTLAAPLGATWVVPSASSEWGVSAFDMQDCEVYGAGATWSQCWPPDESVISMRNNLFQYANVDIESTAELGVRNNLFKGAEWTVLFNTSAAPFCTDNAFDGGSVYLDGAFGHNAFLNGATLESGNPQAGDIFTNLTWVSGPLGRYYQPTNSPLINAGSTNADLLGLYHYTTQTNQVKETNSFVDIGYHYVAVDSNKSPIDMDGDGIPDYLEDINGNGNGADDPTSWLSYNSPTGLSPGDGLQVFTPLK
jgi:hypothetical protein